MNKKLHNWLSGGNSKEFLENIGKLFLRILFGLSLALNHGWPTFSGFLSGESGFPDPIGLGAELSRFLAGSAEFVFTLFVIIGLFTRFSILPVIINFLVAFFIFHSDDPFGDKELAYLYLSASLAILLLGPGKYSLDKLLIFKNGD